jgi:hypothetical protein
VERQLLEGGSQLAALLEANQQDEARSRSGAGFVTLGNDEFAPRRRSNP